MRRESSWLQPDLPTSRTSPNINGGSSNTGRDVCLPRVLQLQPCQLLGLKCLIIFQQHELTLPVQFTRR